MDAVLHRVEALAGTGRYAVTFRRPDGSEQSAVAQVHGDQVEVAEASLPAGWTADSAALTALADALRAVERSRVLAKPAALGLRDLEGGWDVSLGNVVLGADGDPSCIAHGPMAAQGRDVWRCLECGAQARLG